jgi:hypothetical protein
MKSRHSRRTVPTNRSQYAFACGARAGVLNYAQPKGLELIIHFCREDGVAVANEKAISMIGWNCVSKLLQGPFRGWVRGEIAVQDAPRPKVH